jgi:hypothetical protein
MKNIHLLPILQPSRLIKSKINDTIVLEPINVTNDTRFWEYLNISITNNEEIKEENLTKSIYVIDVQNGNIGKLTCKNSFFKGSSKLIEIKWKNKQNIWNYNHIREIILTTDADLIKDGVQAIDDDFLEWFVKNPSCEEVKVIYEPKNFLDTKQGWEYEIIIPKEEIQPQQIWNEEKMEGVTKLIQEQETLEEGFDRIYKELDYREFDFGSFKIGAKWQQEQNEILLNEYHEYTVDCIEVDLKRPLPFKSWFNKFKKK